MFTDSHNHLSWDIDDGIQSREQAEMALKNAMIDGINRIIATPHFIPGMHNKSDRVKMNHRMEEFRILASSYDIEVYRGAELFLNHEYLEMMDLNLCNTLNDSRYLLVEFDVRKDMKYNRQAEDMLFELRLRGYVPVIAHVERYFHTDLEIDRIEAWLKQGCVLQVNRTSILGLHGKVCAKNATTLLRKGLVHVVASDAHTATGRRVCILSDVHDYLAKHYGSKNAHLLCSKNPNHIIFNEDLEPMQIEKNSLMRRLFRKR